MTPSPATGIASQLAVAALWTAAIPNVNAGSVGWYLAPSQSHLLSDGVTKIPANTVFQMGVFAGSFVPNENNRSQWAAHWIAADFANFDAVDNMIDGYFFLESNAVPFSAAKPIYVWGVLIKDDGSSEQWLGTSGTWQMPGADPMAFPLQVDIASASSLLLGTADETSDTIQMEAVPSEFPCPHISGKSWLTHFFNSLDITNPEVGGWHADPDEDGLSNALEFATGSNPVDAQSHETLRIITLQDSVLLAFPGWPAALANIEIVHSTNMTNTWQTLAPSPSYNPASRQWERLLQNTEAREFFRVKVTIPESP